MVDGASLGSEQSRRRLARGSCKARWSAARPRGAWLRSVGGAVGGALLGTFAVVPWAAAAEPAACRSPDPSDWPPPAKPYFMIVVDSSGSMSNTRVSTYPSCPGYSDYREGHARCAVRNTIEAFGGLVEFGLAQFTGFLQNCSSTCYGACSTRYFSGSCGPTTGDGVAPAGDPTDTSAARRMGGNILVPIAPATDVSTLLSWVDNDCAGNHEIGAQGADTPIAGALRDVYRYLRWGWDRPDTVEPAHFDSPLLGSDPLCQRVYTILITDGGESCDDNTAAVDAAKALYEGFHAPEDDEERPLRSVPTYVVNFAGGSITNTNAIAAAGGTVKSLFATDEADLSAAFAGIIAQAIEPEVCDNKDNNCNGCTDEGHRVYCSRNWGSGGCCDWTSPEEREECLAQYRNSIGPGTPQGDKTLLPCWDPDVDGDDPETKWLCVDPEEACDDQDNNCEWDYNEDPSLPGRTSEVDEGFSKCPNCPVPETCDGKDNDCNGVVDELPECGECIPTSEICDGRDNDCDGYVDEADDNASDMTIPCVLATTPGCQGVRACGHRWTSVDGAPLAPGASRNPPNSYSDCDVSTSNEICDGKDNDCNGIIDDGAPGTPCDLPLPAGRTSLVYYDAKTHPNTVCRHGEVPCGGSACVGAVGPEAEVCDGLDNDCDGVVDGALGGGVLPHEGEVCGVCDTGEKRCVDGALTCVLTRDPPQEVCNGLDDDCDGVADDPPLVDAPDVRGCWPIDPLLCEADERCEAAGVEWCPPDGANCQALGDLSEPCALGALVCAGTQGWICQGGRVPASEVCDGVDNDCNEVVDDDLESPVGDQCGSNKGECETGVIECNQGVLKCSGQGPETEVCNGKDDDCDGKVDSPLPVGDECVPDHDEDAYPGNRNQGLCRPGRLVCDPEGSGEELCLYGQGPEPEVCDGIDNDCDGQIDEAGAAPDGIDGTADPGNPKLKIGDPCGRSKGQCEKGALGCVGGVVVCQGGLGPQPEECDCKDNDCDGTTDEEDPPLCSPGKTCVRAGKRCVCAEPCRSGELACLTGAECITTARSSDGEQGSYCIGPDACGDCSIETVTDAQGNVECAPEVLNRPGRPIPVCECKNLACHSPCFGIACDAGLACVPTGWAKETCREPSCYFFGCDKGEVCLGGLCRTDPCAKSPCADDEVCEPDTDYEGYVCTESCAGVKCKAPEHCVEGRCIQSECRTACDDDEVCREAADGKFQCGPSPCQERDGVPTCSDGSYCDPVTGACGDFPCEGVHCPDGQHCEDGECQADKVQGTGGGSSQAETAGASGKSTADAGAGPTQPRIKRWGLATGGSICSHRPGRTPPSPAWLLALAALFALGRGRAARAGCSEKPGCSEKEVSS
jgi:hypothetical protein